MIHNIQLSRNFHEYVFLLRTRKKKNREGFQHSMHRFRNLNSLQRPVDRLPTYMSGSHLRVTKWKPQVCQDGSNPSKPSGKLPTIMSFYYD